LVAEPRRFVKGDTDPVILSTADAVETAERRMAWLIRRQRCDRAPKQLVSYVATFSAANSAHTVAGNI
jgi:hypothetical protein